jgi:predicted RNA binding protein YcfA (HicA-like mRNA interferase family)
MPGISYRALIKRLKKLGWVFYRQGKGSHEFWVHPKNTSKMVCVPKHTKDFATGTITQIVKNLGFKNLKDFMDF